MTAKSIQTKIMTMALTLVLAAAAFTAGTTNADAGRKGRFLTGLAVGALATGLIASERARRRDRVIYVQPRRVYRAAPRRVYRAAPRPAYYGNRAAACAAKYRSYDAASDTYVSYSGQVRRCRL